MPHQPLVSPGDPNPLTGALVGLRALTGRLPGLAALNDLAVGNVYLVGGVVRDALLAAGDPEADPRDFAARAAEVDLAVDGCAVELARRTAEAAGGRLVILSEADDTARVVLPPVAGGLPRPSLDLTGFRGPAGDLIADLTGRDFTLNALAVSLDALLAGNPELIDPLGGQHDLAARRLVLCGAGVLTADPLRVWRGLRLAVQFRLTVPDACWRGMAAAAPGLGRVAGERRSHELRLMLAAGRCADLLTRAADHKLLGFVLPEVAALSGMYQNRYHHLDGLRHTLATLDRVEDLIADPPGWAVAHGWRPERNRIIALKLAALFHDVGKPGAYRVRPDGGLSFPGHDKSSAKLWNRVAARLKLSRAETGAVALMIGVHMRPLNLLLVPEPTPRALRRLTNKAGPLLVDLGLLALADSLATRGPARDPDWEGRLTDLWQRLLNLSARAQAQSQTPLLSGDEVMAGLNIPSGPLVGRLLEELAERRLAGEVESRDQALAWIRTRFDQLSG